MNNESVSFGTTDMPLKKLYDSAEEKLRQNLRMFGDRQVLIEGGGYNKVWLETQPMGGAMYAKRNLRAALDNQKIFMDNQRGDGRLPGSIECSDGKVIPQFDKMQGFCFPDPALDVYYLTGKDPGYLDQLYETLERFDQYLWKFRDSDGDGCLESWCRYDTGEDEAVRYGDAPNYWPGEIAPDQFSVVPMASMDIMSYSFSARKVMADILQIKGRPEEAEACRRKAGTVSGKIREYLWNGEKGALYDRDRYHEWVPVLAHNSLRAMYWGSMHPQDAERFVREHLLNPQEFWTKMPLPSVAANDPAFRNDLANNWSGQSQALTYQRAIRALENYGYYKLIPRLGRKLFDAILIKDRFVQQYDPFTMEPSLIGVDGDQDAYGPAMLAVLEYISRMYGVHAEREKLIWGTMAPAVRDQSGQTELTGQEKFAEQMDRTQRTDQTGQTDSAETGKEKTGACTYVQEFAGHTYRIENANGKAAAFIDGKEVFTAENNMRIETDMQGKILAQYEL